MKMTRVTQAGLALLLIGFLIPVGLYCYYDLYVNWNPVNHPVSLSPGTIEQTFTVNYSSRYFASLEFDTHSTGEVAMPHRTSRLFSRTGLPKEETGTSLFLAIDARE